MDLVGLIPDIPKVYTALAEWLACIVYIMLYRRAVSLRRMIGYSSLACLLLILIQMLIGELPDYLWIPGMLLALVVMYLYVWLCCDFSMKTAGYCLVRLFILAEFAAALEWQIEYYLYSGGYVNRTELLAVLPFAYAVVFCGMLGVEYRHKKTALSKKHFEVSWQELINISMLGVLIFFLSNLSYVYAYTPFSSSVGTQAFNIRTLIDFGGVAILYAYHVQLSEQHVQMEYTCIQNILHTHYAQYRESRENIEVINRKYHDLKHQIQALRSLSDDALRGQYLDEMEQDIREFEAQNKTGNPVLDTVLTSKSMYCARQGITLTCVADGVLLQTIHVMDICTIFGNALDNAIEYELQILDKEKRLIHLSVSAWKAFIKIQVENYYEGTLDLTDGLPNTTKSDKKNHGFGMRSIRYSAEKYGGMVTVTQEKNWFVLTILLPEGK